MSGWVGWVFFAAFLMLLSATFQMIAGFAALFKDDIYAVTQRGLLMFDYSQWGWIHMFIGLVLLLTALSLFGGGMWGRIVGVVLATLSAVANFAFLTASPVWSVLIIILDVLIIYALMVHGGDVRRLQE